MKHNLFSPSPWGKGVNESCVSPSFRREDTSLKTRSALLSSVFFMKFYISRNRIHFTVSSVININAEEKPWSHFGTFSSEAFNSWLINLNLWSRNDSVLQDYWFVMDIQKCGGWGSVLCGTTATWTGCSRLLQCGHQMETQVTPRSPPHPFSSSGVRPSETLILDRWHEPLLLWFCWWVWATSPVLTIRRVAVGGGVRAWWGDDSEDDSEDRSASSLRWFALSSAPCCRGSSFQMRLQGTRCFPRRTPNVFNLSPHRFL